MLTGVISKIVEAISMDIYIYIYVYIYIHSNPKCTQNPPFWEKNSREKQPIKNWICFEWREDIAVTTDHRHFPDFHTRSFYSFFVGVKTWVTCPYWGILVKMFIKSWAKKYIIKITISILGWMTIHDHSLICHVAWWHLMTITIHYTKKGIVKFPCRLCMIKTALFLWDFLQFS